MKRFYAIATCYTKDRKDRARVKVALVQDEKPTEAQMTKALKKKANEYFVTANRLQSKASTVKYDIPIIEIPWVPDAPVGSTSMRHWLIELTIVCHDLKLSDSPKAVVAWPEEPTGRILGQMADTLICDSIMHSCDDPHVFLMYTEILSEKVTETTLDVSYPK